jgi:tubulin monoglycylase TTLL3/8
MFGAKRGQQHEIFGYDIMVDEDHDCWLIEVNSSPAMDYSTPVTERLVKNVLEDTVKVVVDFA